MKHLIAAAALLLGSAATAQTAAPAGAPEAACPAGTRYATMRHSMILPGKMATFEQAVADHGAWYAAHGNKTTTRIVRLLTMAPTGPALSATEVATLTIYEPVAQPAHDAAYAAFIAKYRDSSTIKDEMRMCLPAMGM